MTTLEPRQMLAADAGVAVATAATQTPVSDVSEQISETQHSDVQCSDNSHLVFVDASITDTNDWDQAIGPHSEIVVLECGRDAIDQISEHLQQTRRVASVHIISHGSAGSLQLAGQTIDQSTLIFRGQQIRAWRASLTPEADILLYGCDVAAGLTGTRFVETLATLTGADVAASIDRTGAESGGFNWDLEHQTGNIEHSLVLTPAAMRSMRGHLGVVIYAAGSTGDELMELEVGGQIVDTWFVRDTNADNDQFLPYFYNVDGISADDIKINFVNDLFDPSSGIDRNLRIDRIEVDGVTFQAESPWVYSQGVFVDGIGITEGSFQTEYLASNGYMQFNSNGFDTGGGNNGGGSTITVTAAGDTGDEAMQLLIDGSVVQTYFNVPTSGNTYQFTADQSLTADRIRVAFIGDVYRPEFNYDQNLRVDNITIDGQVFQTESPSTFSTGTFISGQGIVSGNVQSEYLNVDGYFQYGGSGGPGPGPGPGPGGGNSGSFSLVTSEITALENQGSITVEIGRIGGSQGNATIDVFTVGDSAIAGQDYVEFSDRLFFGDGETRKTFTIDLIDNSVGEGTEQFSVRIDNPSGAGLLAPRTSLVTVLDDDSGLPSYTAFNSAAGLSLNGSAQVTGGELELTSAAAQQVGTAFFQAPLPVDSNTSFQSQFKFQMGGGFGTNGADGFTFLLQNSAEGLGAIGRPGGYMGYDVIENSLAIEFDNYLKGGPGASSIGVYLNGNGATAVTEVIAPFDLNDGQTYHAWVDYNGQTNDLAVYVSRTSEKPIFASLITQVALDEIVGSSAYAGFTSGNFNEPNFHRISSWTMTLDRPAGTPQAAPTGDITEQDLITGLTQPLAVAWSPDGRNMYIGEKGGVIKVARDGATNPQTLIDISAQVNNVADRGMVDFALHPDFQNNGFVYLLYTYDPPEVFSNQGNALAGPDGTGNRAGRLMRVTADASTGFTSIVPGSETILLGNNSTWNNFNAFTDSTINLAEPEAGRTASGGYVQDFIKSDSLSHTVGSLAFGLDGNLFVSIGDGASYNQTDPRALSVLNVDSLSGKVLRIDPFTGQGVSDNPFYNGDPNANRSKVYQLGLRNPWRLTVDPTSGQLYIGETGLSSFEEINTGGPGENFGWPYYEGSQGINQRTPQYRNLPGASAFYASGVGKPASIALQHQAGSNVVVLGDILQNSDLGPQYEGDLFYADLYRGGVAHADIGANGEPVNGQAFTFGAEFVVDIQQGPDGSLYYVNLLEGTVGKWVLT
ncbi:MAG: DUF4347 domain-containing protein [Planctomycetota bacterium]